MGTLNKTNDKAKIVVIKTNKKQDRSLLCCFMPVYSGLVSDQFTIYRHWSDPVRWVSSVDFTSMYWTGQGSGYYL